MKLLAGIVAAVLATAVVGRPGVVIHAVGGATVAGLSSGTAGGPTHSFRRALYHAFAAHGYDIHFAGSQDGCNAEGGPALDFDSHHDGFASAKTLGEIRAKLTQNSEKTKRSLAEAAARAAQTGGKADLVTLLVGGEYDAWTSKQPQQIENDFNDLKRSVEPLSGNARHKLGQMKVYAVMPPPPGGKLVNGGGDGAYRQRDMRVDTQYDQFRFFLTWRGKWYERGDVIDCFSQFDFMQHYTPDGLALNALGEQAYARCIFDFIRRKRAVAAEGSLDDGAKCGGGSAVALQGVPNVQPIAVNPELPPLMDIVAPAAVRAPKGPHWTCEEASGDGGNRTAAGQQCCSAPAFPAVSPLVPMK